VCHFGKCNDIVEHQLLSGRNGAKHLKRDKAKERDKIDKIECSSLFIMMGCARKENHSQSQPWAVARAYQLYFRAGEKPCSHHRPPEDQQ